MPKSLSDHHAVGVWDLSSDAHERLTMCSGRKWFDCAECHMEEADHPLLQHFDMVEWLQDLLRLEDPSLNFRLDIRMQKM